LVRTGDSCSASRPYVASPRHQRRGERLGADLEDPEVHEARDLGLAGLVVGLGDRQRGVLAPHAALGEPTLQADRVDRVDRRGRRERPRVRVAGGEVGGRAGRLGLGELAEPDQRQSLLGPRRGDQRRPRDAAGADLLRDLAGLGGVAGEVERAGALELLTGRAQAVALILRGHRQALQHALVEARVGG
jgi:hypothetical protein